MTRRQINYFNLKRLTIVLIASLLGTSCGSTTMGSNFDIDTSPNSFEQELKQLVVPATDPVCAAVLYDYGVDGSSEYKRCLRLQGELNKASWEGDVQLIRSLIKKGANPSAGYYQDGPPLNSAVMKGHLEAVKILVANGADVNEKRIFGGTPLKTAVFYNQSEIAIFLMRMGADICYRGLDDDLKEENAFDIAKNEGHRELIRILRANNAGNCR